MNVVLLAESTAGRVVVVRLCLNKVISSGVAGVRSKCTATRFLRNSKAHSFAKRARGGEGARTQ